MEVTLIAMQTAAIDFAPANDYAEILQNIRTILATPIYSVPLDRAFGVDMSYLDRPMVEAQSAMASEIVTAIRRYEPRAEVSEITWEATDDGVLRPKVKVILSDSD